MKAGLRSRLARDPLVASCACCSFSSTDAAWGRQLVCAEPGCARGNSDVEGELGRYPRAARGRFWRASAAATALAARRRVVWPFCATRGGRRRALLHAVQLMARYSEHRHATKNGPIEPPDVRNLVHLHRTALARDRPFNLSRFSSGQITTHISQYRCKGKIFGRSSWMPSGSSMMWPISSVAKASTTAAPAAGGTSNNGMDCTRMIGASERPDR